jgi:hypothetical protein
MGYPAVFGLKAAGVPCCTIILWKIKNIKEIASRVLEANLAIVYIFLG